MTDQEIPPGVELETVYLVEVPYTPEAPDRRPAVRRQHLARIARLMEAGVIVEAGGGQDWSKAVLVIRAASEADALRVVAEDVYTAAGVWTSPRATPFGRVVASGEPTGRGG